MSIIDFKAMIIDAVNEATVKARKEIQRELSLKLRAKKVGFYVLNPDGLEFHSEVVAKLAISENYNDLFLFSVHGKMYKVHPSSGLEILSEKD